VILHVDRGWLLDAAQRYVRPEPDVTDWGSLAAAVARHADEVMGIAVYPEAHHRAAALMHTLVRLPALERRSELFGAAVAAAYLTASGLTVTVSPKDAAALAQRVRNGLSVRDLAAEIKRGWLA
jgi:hypothetical protein